ncbi:MAG: serine/threonine-protein kinase, partial [Planctomycetota bacterium]
MSDSSASKLPEGTRLAHYEVTALVGEGAMGTVYRAHDTSLDRTVAIKVLRPEIADEGQVIERFNREARAAARVNHPNLTHIYFVGPEEEHHYFAMEYVPGLTLHEHVENYGPMDVDETLDVLIQAAKGLEAAHAADVIHRDVKPSNLKLAPGGVVKITDFGLSKQ